jgi:hypothetical protein
MSKTKSSKKNVALRLHRETLQRLDSTQLGHVLGGLTPTALSDCEICTTLPQ